MSKKISAVIISLMLAFSCACLAACGSSKTNNATAKEKETAQWMGEHGYFDNKK